MIFVKVTSVGAWASFESPPPSPEGNVRPGVFFCLLRTATKDISGSQDKFMFFDRFYVFLLIFKNLYNFYNSSLILTTKNLHQSINKPFGLKTTFHSKVYPRASNAGGNRNPAAGAKIEKPPSL